MSTTVEGRSIWCYFGETCGYHSKLDGYGVCLGEASCVNCYIGSNDILGNFVQKCINYACQKQCHVCLDSHLTKPCL